ncbi:MAG: hypothetical protein ABIQ31_03615 [Ferruginibacter sp.]
MGNSNLLFESIFKRKLSQAGTRKYLTEVIKEYPYFSPAHFFLLLETDRAEPGYHEVAARTSVVFNNLHWLQFQLEASQEESEPTNKDPQVLLANRNDAFSPVIEPAENKVDSETSNTDQPGNEIELVSDDAAVNGEKDLQAQVPGTDDNEINEPVGAVEEIVDFSVEANEGIIPAYTEEAAKFSNVAAESEEASENTQQEILPVIDDHAGLPQLKDEAGDPPSSEITPAPIIESTSQQENIEETIPEEKAGTDGIISPDSISPVLSKETVTGLQENKNEELLVEAENVVSNGKHEQHFPGNDADSADILHTGHFNNDKSPLVNESADDLEPGTEEEIAPLNFRLNIDTSNTTEKEITFEPLHTSDYFASLGIKLSDDIKPSDKLGKQLKSFTEWLKTMKKVHNDQLPPLSGQSDMSIQKLAEQSNKEDAIVTEAMADVLLQQGKAEKAIDVYKKLSLLNPSKSTYFAAKIDQLKEH